MWKMKKTYIKIASIVICTILLIEGLLLYSNKLKAADDSMEILESQIIRVIERNQESIRVLTETLKEEYIVRARTVSYVISEKDITTYTIDDWEQIASMVNVDEIHLFNKKGVIFAGSCPQYYGMSLNDGEQIQYFLPMLSDVSLTICQEVTPNTAEQREMMYAMTWDSQGEYMVQIGIEPSRLLEEMKTGEIGAIVDNMPMLAGIHVYVADSETGIVQGSTQKDMVGTNIYDICASKEHLHWNRFHTDTILGERVRCKFSNVGNYTIGVTYHSHHISNGLVRNIVITFFYLLLGAAIIAKILMKMDRQQEIAKERIEKSYQERDEQYRILKSLAEIYHTVHLIDLETGKLVSYKSVNYVESFVSGKQQNNVEIMRKIMMSRCKEEDYDRVLAFTDLTTVRQRLKGKKMISCEFCNVDGYWLRISFICIDADEQENPVQVFFTTQNIQEEKLREISLKMNSITDVLTGVYNRRAYKEDAQEYLQNGFSKDFTVVSMDVNGLKVVNDTLGHAAGDELLKGAVICMQHAFSTYGKIYRTGGDEFMALLEIDRKRLETQIEDFENNMKSWHGELVQSVSVSIGYAKADEATDFSIEEMEKIADERMYESKANYYASKKDA